MSHGILLRHTGVLAMVMCAALATLAACTLGRDSLVVGATCHSAAECNNPDEDLVCTSTNVDVPGAPRACMPSLAPEEWTCPLNQFGDTEACDCGCGFLDPDCPSSAAAVCDFNACADSERVDPNDNTRCI